MSNNVSLVIDDLGLATVILNRPDIHNAFDDRLIQELLQILQQISTNSKVRAVVLKSTGKSFSAGADLNWMRRIAAYSYEENIQDAQALSDLMHTLKYLNKPTLACVQGPAFGGGVGLVACCDIAVASTEASFCLSEVKIGLIPAIISPYVVSAIGERAARYYFLTAATIDAAEAHRLGLISQLVAAEHMENTVNTIIGQLLNNGPAAVVAAKSLLNRVSVNPYSAETLRQNVEAIATIRISKEGKEGLAAFLEKRKPSWPPS